MRSTLTTATLARLTPALLLLLLLALPAAARGQEVLEYYGTDALGTVRVVYTPAGTLVARTDLLPFGEPLETTPGGPAEQFTGQERDPEAGQDYFHARMYQPRAGRFTGVDPVYAGLFDPQQWNRYAYVRNSPLNGTDSSGLFVEPAFDAACQEITCYQEQAGVGIGGGGSYWHQLVGEWEAAYAAGVYANFWQQWEQSQQQATAAASQTSEPVVDTTWMITGVVVVAGAILVIADGPLPFGDAAAASLFGARLAAVGAGASGTVGAMQRRTFDAAVSALRHLPGIARPGAAAGPTNGQAALDVSLQVSAHSTRRIGIDYAQRQFVVFDEHAAGLFHGHVRSWSDLTQAMQATLRGAGMVDSRGNIF